MNTFATSAEYSVWACGTEVDKGLPFAVAKDIADELREHQWDVRVCKSKQTHPELSKPKADGITLFCAPQQENDMTRLAKKRKHDRKRWREQAKRLTADERSRLIDTLEQQLAVSNKQARITSNQFKLAHN